MSSRPGARLDLRLLLCFTFALPALQCGGSDDGNNEMAAAAGASAGTPGAAPAEGMSAAAAASNDTWSGYAQGFFTSYCVSCHNDDNAGDAARDLHQRSVVDAESAEIACGLSKSSGDWRARGCSGFPPARQFPAGNGAKPSDSERDRLIAWIDAGRP